MSELKDGVQIAFWLPQSSGANVTLNLTLADGSTTGAIPCYFSAGTRLGTQYSAGNVIRLTYRENAKYYSSTIAKGWWADANYNTDTYDRIRHGTVKAKETCAYFRLIVSDSEGYYQLAAGKAFDIRNNHKVVARQLANRYAGCHSGRVLRQRLQLVPQLEQRLHVVQ